MKQTILSVFTHFLLRSGLFTALLFGGVWVLRFIHLSSYSTFYVEYLFILFVLGLGLEFFYLLTKKQYGKAVINLFFVFCIIMLGGELYVLKPYLKWWNHFWNTFWLDSWQDLWSMWLPSYNTTFWIWWHSSHSSIVPYYISYICWENCSTTLSHAMITEEPPSMPYSIIFSTTSKSQTYEITYSLPFGSFSCKNRLIAWDILRRFRTTLSQ